MTVPLLWSWHAHRSQRPVTAEWLLVNVLTGVLAWTALP